jgi:electron transfer flavoprotein alpha/beta subunit
MSVGNHPIEVVVCVGPSPDDAPEHRRSLRELDLRAVELVCSLARDATVHTTAVSVGSARQTSHVLMECLARGIQRAVCVADELLEDGLIVAACLAEALGEIRPDLIVCAQRAPAGGHGVVPAALADRLGLPFVANVVGLAVDWSAREARFTQMLERGARWHWDSPIPAVCAVERDVAVPRYLAARRMARVRAGGDVERLEVQTAAARVAVLDEYGAQTVVAHGPARIRPKKTKAPPKQLSAADRMKFLRGGGAAAGPGRAEDGPRSFTGSAEAAAREIIAVLEERELL